MHGMRPIIEFMTFNFSMQVGVCGARVTLSNGRYVPWAASRCRALLSRPCLRPVSFALSRLPNGLYCGVADVGIWWEATSLCGDGAVVSPVLTL